MSIPPASCKQLQNMSGVYNNQQRFASMEDDSGAEEDFQIDEDRKVSGNDHSFLEQLIEDKKNMKRMSSKRIRYPDDPLVEGASGEKYSKASEEARLVIDARLREMYEQSTPHYLQCEEVWQLYRRAMMKSMQTNAQWGVNFNHNHEVKVDFLGPFIEKARELLPGGEEMVNKFISCVSVCVIAFRNLSDPITVGACCTSIAGILGIASKAMTLVATLFTKAFNCLKQIKRTRVQVDVEEEDHSKLFEYMKEANVLGALTYMGGVGFAVIIAFIMGKLPGKHTVDEMMSRVKHLPGTVKSAVEIQTFGEKIVGELISGVKKYFFGMDDSFDMYAGVKEWYEEVDALLSKEAAMKIRCDASYQTRADSVYMRGLNIAKEFDALKVPWESQRAFRSYLFAASRLREIAHHSGAGYMRPRVEPLVIQLWGASGVGKSFATSLMCADILRQRGMTSTDEMFNAMYYRKVGQEFWDGFTSNHKIVIYDDFGALKDIAGTPNPEFLEIIHSGNPAPFPVHMADIASKANTFFRAEAVILTSNCPDYYMPSLTYPQAVKRRFEIRARMHIKDEYARQMLEAGVFVNRVDGSKVGDDITAPYLFDMVHPEADGDAQPPQQYAYTNLSYSEFMEKVLAAHAKKMERGTNMLEKISEYMTRAQIQDDEQPSCSGVNVELDERAQFEARVRIEAQKRQDELREKVRPGIEKRREQLAGEYEQAQMAMPLFENDLSDVAERELDLLRHAPMDSRWFDRFPLLCVFLQMLSLIIPGHLRAPDKIHVDIRDFADLRIGGLDRRALDLIIPRPFDYFQIAKCYDSSCFLIPGGDNIVPMVRAIRAAQGYAAREPGVDKMDFFVKVYLLFAGEREFLPMACPKRCPSRLAQVVENVKWNMSPDGFAQIAFANTPLEVREQVAHMTPEEVETRRLMIGGVLLVLQLISCWFFVRAVWYLVKAVRMWLSPKKDLDEKIASGEIATFCVGKTEVEVAYPDDKGNAAPIKTLTENARVYTDDKGNTIPVRVVAEKSAYVDDKGNNSTVKTMSEGVMSGKAHSFVNENAEKAIIRGVGITTAQAVVDENAVTLYGKLLYNSMYKIEALNVKGEWRHMMNITFLFGRIALVNKHLLFALRSKEFIRIRGPSCMDGTKVAVKDLIFATTSDEHEKYKYRDVALIAFPRQIRQHPNILAHLCTVDDFARFKEVQKASLIGFLPHKEVITRVYTTKNVIASDRLLDMSASLDQPEWTVCIRDKFQYDIETNDGECGMLLISMQQSHMRKILGIHCSGQKDGTYQGNSTPISRELVELLASALLAQGVSQDALISNSNFDDIRAVQAQMLHVENETFTIEIESVGDHFSTFGYIADPVFAGGKSEIRPSPIGESITINKTAPARLRPFRKDGKTVDPVALAMKKADVASMYVDDDMLNSCSKDLLSLYRTEVFEDRRVLTLDEAVKGVEGNPLMPAISRSSSPGYPWIHERTYGKGKEQWLGKGEEWNISSTFVERYEQRMASARLGIRVPTLWVDTLKDERRPLDRVAAGKTRLFSVGEMTFNVAVRQYFLPVAAHLMRHRIKFESCVGINPYSTDWEMLAKRMMMKGRRICAGDFSGFDGSLLGKFMWAAFDIMCALMDFSSEDRLIANVLFSDIVHSNHLCHNVVYGWNHSQPSGNPLTVILNSIINSLIVRYCWQIITVGTPEFGMKNFHRHVATGNYGDDNWINISSYAIDFFNMNTITEGFRKFGFTYTDEHKGTDVAPFRELNEISFLKRGIHYDSECARWKSPLSLDTILEMAQWVRGKENHHELCALNMETAIYELSQHSRGVFESLLPRFEEAAQKLMVRPVFETYDTYQHLDGSRYLSVPWIV